jgi:hypothetical protein
MRKEYDGGAVATKLNGSINNSTTSVSVADASTYPSGPTPFVIAVGRGTATEEKMLVASRAGNTFTITTRGYDGSTAQSHADQTVVEHVLDAITIDEANRIANVMSADGALITRTSGVPAEIALGSTGLPLLAGATVPAYGQVNTAGIADDAITTAKIGTGQVTSGKILDGTILNIDINASAGIVDTKLATISTADKVSLSALDIDGAAEINAALVDADVFPVDDGNGGTNRKSLMSRLATYIFGKVSSDITVTSTGTATIANNAVTSAKIADGTIVEADLANGAVTSAKILDGTIATADLGNGIVTNAKLNTTAGEPGGAWLSYTPTWTNISNGTKTGAYMLLGKTCFFRASFVVTTSPNVAGNFTVTLPLTGVAGNIAPQFNASFYDNDVTRTYPAMIHGVSTTALTITGQQFPGLKVSYNLTPDSADPFLWAANDRIEVSGFYEVA